MIKIIKGVYGHMTESGIVRPKTSADEPFTLTPAQEERLVGLGVAEYVGPADMADIPADALGAPVHASIDGLVSAITEQAITLVRG